MLTHLKFTRAKNGIIKVEDDFLQAVNTAEVFEKWNKNLKENGIFEYWATPYNISSKALIKNSLTQLTKDDSSRIFNQFAEILRHNVVSDKPNAFNKLITLLLCKIVDEEKADNEELAFQWFENDTNINLQKRLNDLYKTGMEKYLTKVVTDYSDKDIDDQFFSLDEKQRDAIKQIMTELRLKKNNEFAFKEVFNDASFEENSRVLKEVVELLQPYQFRYNQKQQFLGDFFELLLNTSIKQEAGQFFTPVPLARFIINSIPLREIINKKISSGENDFLPYIIDYAVGSGHFITEAMDEIHKAIIELNNRKDLRPNLKKQLSAWVDNLAFDWAYKYVYGIEKDYRLVKTAKVSCFLNGDGLARIFNADGLANFETSSDYQEILKITSKSDPKDNQQFEVLIANPPYSVSAFKNTLVNGDKSFELYNRLTDDSSEIECLFIERTKQLLKDSGYAGIILPSSILSNAGIYSDARAILLKYFKIVAITEFSSNTFMATGTNTVTLFLERRNNTDWQKVEHTVNNFFLNTVDVTCNGIEYSFSKYVAHVYKTVSFEDYISFIKQKPNENIKKHELIKDYQKYFDNLTSIKNLKNKQIFKSKSEEEQQIELDKLFYSEIFAIEKEKLLYFVLVYPQKTLLIKANPDNKNETEKEFLGYEFSNRRGHEGIKPYGARTIQEATKLYDENNLLNPDRVNTYIYNAFLGNDITINENLQKYITKQNLVDMMNFDRVDFQKSISLAVKKKVEIDDTLNSKLVKFDSVATLEYGKSLPERDRKEGEYPVMGSNGIVGYHNEFLIKSPSIIVGRKGSVGKITLIEKDNFPIDTAFYVKYDSAKIHYKFLYYLLISLSLEDLANKMGVPGLNRNDVYNLQIPLPPKDVQEKIVKEIEEIERKEKVGDEKIKQLKETLFKLFDNAEYKVSISSIAKLKGERIDPQNFPNQSFNYLGLEHIQSKTGQLTKWETTQGASLQSTKNVFKKGDLLYGKLRPYLNKVYLAEFDGICSTDILVLETEHAKILKYILLSDIFVKQSSELMKGVNLPRLQVKDFMNFQIPFPKDTEQEKIVAEIEKLEVQISELKEQLENIASEKDAVLKKYL